MDRPEQTPERFRGHAVAPLVSLPGVARNEPEPAPEQQVPAGELSVSGVLDDGDTPTDVIDLLVLEAFSSGRQPFSRTCELENVRPTAVLVPEGARVVRDASTDHQHSLLAVGEGWTIRAVRWPRNRRAAVTVTATQAEVADAKLALAVQDAVEPPSTVEDRVPIGFWYLTPRGPRRMPRDIESSAWVDIRPNYAQRVAAALEPLIALTPAEVNGRLLLLHGPPGTGKTTLLRALAREWRTWCRVDCVLDPERLFGDPAYLLDVALGDDDYDEDDETSPRWRMLLLEDCDELIRGDAKSTAGQSLSRLLNLTDGLLGQGRNVLVAITTNEDIGSLHPAVVRPGRSLAHLEVGRLSPAEATAWLTANEVTGPAPSNPTTLAELFALRAGGAPAPEPAPGTGLYL